jgi:hypothetical protein
MSFWMALPISLVDDIPEAWPYAWQQDPALDSFGELFMSELWQVFGPARRLARNIRNERGRHD